MHMSGFRVYRDLGRPFAQNLALAFPEPYDQHLTGSAGRTYRATRFILANASETAVAKIPKTPKDTAPYDQPAYATSSDDDVASISKFI
jgi:hypothetical protein